MVGSWLRGLWRRSRPQRIVMYTRQGCHLCDEVWTLLEAERSRHDFELEKIDIDADAALAERYGLDVPVVAADGVVRFRGRVNPVLLRRLFR